MTSRFYSTEIVQVVDQTSLYYGSLWIVNKEDEENVYVYQLGVATINSTFHYKQLRLVGGRAWIVLNI